MKEAILEAEGLSVSRRDKSQPVRGINFTLKRGTTLGVIGESGAGKSTLALALMGLHDQREAVTGGSIRWRGRELADIPESEWLTLRGRKLAMVFQDPVASLDPALRVDRQVAGAIRQHYPVSRREAGLRAASLLAEMGFGPDLLKSSPYPYQLSGGLAQRAMIALALAAEPELLIADEPTSSLDVTSQAAIVSLLMERQRRQGLTMIFISHDLALVASLADDILVMKDGEAVEYGPRGDVISSPAHPYTASLLEAWREYQRPRQRSAAGA